MRRGVFSFTILLTIGVGAVLALGLSIKSSGAQDPMIVTITPVGPTQAQIDAALRDVNAHPTAQRYLQGNRTRQMGFELLERPQFSLGDQYRATFYDYTNNRPVLVTGAFADSRLMTVTLGDVQPLPSPEEFEAAVEILKSDPKFGPGLIEGKTIPYRPMPPLASESVGAERTLHVGLTGGDIEPQNQIVAVNMIRNMVSEYKQGAPPTSLASAAACGIPGSGQSTTPRGTAGQAFITVTQGPQTVWEMLVIRPSVSSGTRGSGVELRDVKYRGKQVFKRAHVPILNVRYDSTCGPYRDWQWQEGMFIANGTDIAAGIRQCSTAPQTIMESLTDTGNFRGVAVYVNPINNELLVISELEAGWYRYISRWEFTADGVIRARFGFDGVNNSCVCITHYHHAYWRFDFDLGTAGKNRFTEFDTFAFNTPVLAEVKRFRDYVRNRHWAIENIVSGDLIKILPGHADGVADFYARGDAWFLRYRSTELDDGVNTTGPNNTEAKLDNFVTGESLDGQDVVMWYGGHFDHVDGNLVSHPEDHGGHLVGPDIVVVRW